MSLTRKYIEVDFSLAKGQFLGANGKTGNSYTAKGLRMSARITTPGGEDGGNLELAIFGMTDSEMNALTVLPFAMNAVGQNTVVVRAGDTPNPSAVAFQGSIDSAFCDASRQPSVCFKVVAHGVHLENIKPAAATSMQGSTDVAGLMGKLAKDIGRSLEANGVSQKIQNPNFPGSTGAQIAALARAAGLMYIIEHNTVAIWKTGQARQGNTITVSPETGLVSYPSFTSSGILLTILFQGTIKFGAKIHVQSGLQPACGDWGVTYMEHALDCETPNGSWFTTLQAGRLSVSDSE